MPQEENKELLEELEENEQIETTDDTQAETSTDDTEAETSVDPYAAKLQELGLSDKYKTVDDALSALPFAQGELTRFQQERADWLREKQTFQNLLSRIRTEPPQPRTEDIVDGLSIDPVNSLRQAGFVTKEDLQSVQQRLDEADRAQKANDLASFLSEHEDLREAASYVRTNRVLPPMGQYPAWDRLQSAYERSGLAGKTDDDISVLRLVAPAVFPPKKPAVPAVPNQQKAHAKTAGGGLRKSGEPDYSKMTAQQIYEDMEKRGLISS